MSLFNPLDEKNADVTPQYRNWRQWNDSLIQAYQNTDSPFKGKFHMGKNEHKFVSCSAPLQRWKHIAACRHKFLLHPKLTGLPFKTLFTHALQGPSPQESQPLTQLTVPQSRTQLSICTLLV
jgi:hypothetical protein